MRAAAKLALHVSERGGSMLASNIHAYYAANPQHKGVIGKLRDFCAAHKGLLVCEGNLGETKIKLPQVCCYFLRNACTKKTDHQGFLHLNPPPGAVHCSFGQKCIFGHFAQIEAQSGAQPSAGEAVVAANLALFVHQNGGSLTGGKISEYYKKHPEHKPVISEPGLRVFTACYDGLFAFARAQGDDGRLTLAPLCCHFLQGVCKGKKDHAGKLHTMPQATDLLHCTYGPDCKHGQTILEVAKGRFVKPSVPSAPSAPDTHERPKTSHREVLVSEVRWSHDCIKATFRDGKLVVGTLLELLQEKLAPSQLPQMEVLEFDGSYYVISGNRRLWVLKELQRLTGQEVKVQMKCRSVKLSDFQTISRMFTTKNQGESVDFYCKDRQEALPGMCFALAAKDPELEPTPLDVALGKSIGQSAGVGLIELYQTEAWQGADVDRSLLDYLQQKPHLFNVAEGNKVQLTPPCSMEAMKLASVAASGGRQAPLQLQEDAELSDSSTGDAEEDGPDQEGDHLDSERLDEGESANSQMDPDSAGLELGALEVQGAFSAEEDPEIISLRSHASEPSVRREDAGCLGLLLPLRLAAVVDAGEFADLVESCVAHRLVFQANAPMKAALRSGWLDQSKLPTMVLSQADLEELSGRLGWTPATSGFVNVPDSLHRISFGFSASGGMCRITAHIGRYVPDASQPMRRLLDAGSTILVGPAGCGKTTALRDAAVALSHRQVLALDFSNELSDLARFGVGYMVPNADEVRGVSEAINWHLPEVIIAEFSSPRAAIEAGEICDEAGVRLICSIRGTMQSLVRVFTDCAGQSSFHSGVKSVSFPFPFAVESNGQRENVWRLYPDAPAAVCSIAGPLVPGCTERQIPSSEE
ncbi:unnamed protein product [Effrenium voratum]|nr:unnamed protein product [Effrenium voratum]